jgi:hypothetical protein
LFLEATAHPLASQIHDEFSSRRAAEAVTFQSFVLYTCPPPKQRRLQQRILNFAALHLPSCNECGKKKEI